MRMTESSLHMSSRGSTLIRDLKLLLPDNLGNVESIDRSLVQAGMSSGAMVAYLGAVDEAFGIDWDWVEENNIRLTSIADIAMAVDPEACSSSKSGVNAMRETEESNNE